MFYNVPVLAKAFFVLIVLYFLISTAGIISLYMARDTWEDEFKRSMRCISFKVLLFFYLPISITKRMMN